MVLGVELEAHRQRLQLSWRCIQEEPGGSSDREEIWEPSPVVLVSSHDKSQIDGERDSRLP